MLSLLTTKHIDLEIKATAHQANGEWPHVIVRLNQQVIYNDLQAVVAVKFHGEGNLVDIEIELTDKENRHTKVDCDGNITDNQALTLDAVLINGVDLIKTGLIHQVGTYIMRLTSDKMQLFETLNISTAPSTNLSMHENGVWHIQIPQPALSYLSGLQAQIESWEQGNWQHLTKEIYDKIEICKTLEKHTTAADQNNR